MRSKKIKGLISMIGVTTVILGSLVGCVYKETENTTDNNKQQTTESSSIESSTTDNKNTDGINNKKDDNQSSNTIKNNSSNKNTVSSNSANDEISNFIEANTNKGNNDIKNVVKNKQEHKANNNIDNKKQNNDVIKPVHKPVIKPIVKNVRPNDIKVEKPAVKPVVNPNKPINKPVEKPSKPEVKPDEKPNKLVKPNKPVEDKVIAVAYVKADVLNVRSESNKDSNIIGTLTEGTKVEIVKIGENWDKIKYKGSYGYVSKKYLYDKPIKKPNKPNKPVEKPTEKPNKPEKTESKPEQDKVIGIAYVTSSTLDVNEKEDDGSKTLGTLKYGDKVEVLGRNGLWYNIKYNGGHGYVYNNLTDQDINNIKYEYMSELSKQTFYAINQFRKENGVKELKLSKECEDIAKKQAEKNAHNVTAEHDFDEIGLYNYKGTPESFVEQWANSPGHRKNMLDSNSTVAGVGVYKDSTGRFFVVCIFQSDN